MVELRRDAYKSLSYGVLPQLFLDTKRERANDIQSSVVSLHRRTKACHCLQIASNMSMKVSEDGIEASIER